MKMSNLCLLLALATTLFASSAFAANRAGAAAGVQVVVRSVVDKKLVVAPARSILRLALETGRASLSDMSCDRALGADVCSIYVTTKDDPATDEAEETTYGLIVTIRQGVVVSARWTLVAG